MFRKTLKFILQLLLIVLVICSSAISLLFSFTLLSLLISGAKVETTTVVMIVKTILVSSILALVSYKILDKLSSWFHIDTKK